MVEVASWAPIDTAPKDQVIDLWLEYKNPSWSHRVVDCFWSKSKNCWCHDPEDKMNSWPIEDNEFHKITHWMPRPRSPFKDKFNENKQFDLIEKRWFSFRNVKPT